MAHRLRNHQGKCRNVHGHSWEVEVFITGSELHRSGPSEGMLEDYAVIKEAVNKIDLIFDHAICLDVEDPLSPLLVRLGDQFLSYDLVQKYVTSDGIASVDGSDNGVKLVVIPFAPTSERLAHLWFDMMEKMLNCSEYRVSRVEVKETCTSRAMVECK
jgi:6-pyruvoyltetrahydropterin/6-carboxytetrahydropterin synthase